MINGLAILLSLILAFCLGWCWRGSREEDETEIGYCYHCGNRRKVTIEDGKYICKKCAREKEEEKGKKKEKRKAFEIIQ